MHKSQFLKNKHLHYRYPEFLSAGKRVYCDPVTITAVTLVAAAGATKAYGEYQAGKSQQKYYEYLSEQNIREAEAAQKTAEMQTTIAQNEAAQRAKELKGDVSRVKGAQRAAMAAIGLTGVSAEDVLMDTVNRAKLDEFNIRYNADISSWAYKKEAAEKGWALRNQATLFRFAGKEARTAAALNMTSTILGTASSIIGMKGLFAKGTPAVAGEKGYGLNTPQGVTNMGTWSKWTPQKLW